MNITASLAKLKDLLKLLKINATVEIAEQSRIVQRTLDELEHEAERLMLPWGLVRQKTTSLRHHFGVLLGTESDDGFDPGQHVSWVIGDLNALRSEHCFGPALDREARGAHHGDDWRTIQ